MLELLQAGMLSAQAANTLINALGNTELGKASILGQGLGFGAQEQPQIDPVMQGGNMSQSINPINLLNMLSGGGGGMSTVPSSATRTALPVPAAATSQTTAQAATIAPPQTSFGERISQAFQAPQAVPGGRQQTAWEKWGTSDTSLGLSAILGNLASAVDPTGWGGGLGSAMSKMSQGEMANRNLAERAFEQKQMNQNMLALLQSLVQTNTAQKS